MRSQRGRLTDHSCRPGGILDFILHISRSHLSILNKGLAGFNLFLRNLSYSYVENSLIKIDKIIILADIYIFLIVCHTLFKVLDLCC